MAFLATSLVGIAGSVVGGLLARLFSKPADASFFHLAGFFLSIVGAVILLLVLTQFQLISLAGRKHAKTCRRSKPATGFLLSV